jgi:hypothetical protein
MVGRDFGYSERLYVTDTEGDTPYSPVASLTEAETEITRLRLVTKCKISKISATHYSLLPSPNDV